MEASAIHKGRRYYEEVVEDVASKSRIVEDVASESRIVSRKRKRRGRDRDLDSYLLKKYAAAIPGRKLDKRRTELQNKIKSLIEKSNPASEVVSYGSTSAHVSVRSSDVDMTVFVESDDLDATIDQVAQVLEKGGIVKLKVWDTDWHGFLGYDEKSKTYIDLTLNNKSGPMASDFIRSIVDVNETVKVFLTLIKHYSKCHGINKPSEGTLKSIGFIYMGMYDLQRNGVISKFLGKEGLREIVEAQTSESEVEKTSQVSCPCPGIGQLFGSFFRYYSEEHDFKRYAISVNGGSLVEKNSLGWGNNKDYTLAIVDPFGEKNIGRTVDGKGLLAITKSFTEAYGIIANAEMPDRLFKRYKFERKVE